VLGIN